MIEPEEPEQETSEGGTRLLPLPILEGNHFIIYQWSVYLYYTCKSVYTDRHMWQDCFLWKNWTQNKRTKVHLCVMIMAIDTFPSIEVNMAQLLKSLTLMQEVSF